MLTSIEYWPRAFKTLGIGIQVDVSCGRQMTVCIVAGYWHFPSLGGRFVLDQSSYECAFSAPSIAKERNQARNLFGWFCLPGSREILIDQIGHPWPNEQFQIWQGLKEPSSPRRRTFGRLRVVCDAKPSGEDILLMQPSLFDRWSCRIQEPQNPEVLVKAYGRLTTRGDSKILLVSLDELPASFVIDSTADIAIGK